MAHLIKLDGRRALVTGGGRGIGRSIALALANAGADVAVAARSRAELETVANEIAALGRRGVCLVLDLMSREAIGPGVKRAAEELGGLDILVNNAGGTIDDGAGLLNPLDHDPRAFEDNIFLNLIQAFYTTKAALPYMLIKTKVGTHHKYRFLRRGSSWNGTGIIRDGQAWAGWVYALDGLRGRAAWNQHQCNFRGSHGESSFGLGADGALVQPCKR